MKERPILFNSEMVKAVLDGRKTQTRRIIVPQPIKEGWDGLVKTYKWGEKHGLYRIDELIEECPYGQTGDRLWVRETFQTLGNKQNTVYRADGKAKLTWDVGGQKGEELVNKWRPSIFMHRWASRITLEITGVRVERVQDIKVADIEAEGHQPFVYPDGRRELSSAESYSWFINLWNSINEKRGYGWEVNPWCWCISFKVVKQ